MLSRSLKFVLKTQLFGNEANFTSAYRFLNYVESFKKFSTTVKPDILFSPNEVEIFSATFTPKLVNDLKDLNDYKFLNQFSDGKERLFQTLEYPYKIVDSQKDIITLSAYKILEDSQNLTEKNINLACLLGWFTQMIQTVLYMSKDVIEETSIRNNNKTWHTTITNGKQTANDVVVLESSIFLLLKKYFSDHPNYIKIMDIFHSTLFKGFYGQNLEETNRNIEKFNMNLLEKIAKYGASTYYILPVKSAFYLTNLKDDYYVQDVDTILEDIAILKKIEDDFLDSFDEQGKNLNVKLGLCSWLAVIVREKGDDAQNTVLKNYYGKADQESVDKITSLYKQLDIHKEFDDVKNLKNKLISRKIKTVQHKALRQCLNHILKTTLRLN